MSKTFQTGAKHQHQTLPLMLLKTEMENRLQRYTLKLDEQVEKAIHSMTEKYKKAMLWNIDERFPRGALLLLGAFSIFNFRHIKLQVIWVCMAIVKCVYLIIILPIRTKVRTVFLKIEEVY